MNITILGAGAFGSALAKVLEENHHTITFYDPIKFPDITLESSLKSAQAIVVVSPNSAIPTLTKTLINYPIPTILASKGLLNLSEFAPRPPIVLSGPGFAEDLLAKKPTSLVATDPLAQTLFQTSWLSIVLSDDPIGVLICGSLKNAYAIGSGLLSTSEIYLDKALDELKSYLKNHGASPTTADLPCGDGDLTLTCTDPRSRNFQFGLNFARGLTAPPKGTLEGLATLAAIEDYQPYPILNAIHEILASRLAIQALQGLLQ